MLSKLYSEKESIIHRIDIKTKIFYTFVYVVSLILMNNLITVLISFISLVFLLIFSKIGMKKIFFFIKTIFQL